MVLMDLCTLVTPDCEFLFPGPVYATCLKFGFVSALFRLSVVGYLHWKMPGFHDARIH